LIGGGCQHFQLPGLVGHICPGPPAASSLSLQIDLAGPPMFLLLTDHCLLLTAFFFPSPSSVSLLMD
jgi:hypothetical protein